MKPLQNVTCSVLCQFFYYKFIMTLFTQNVQPFFSFVLFIEHMEIFWHPYIFVQLKRPVTIIMTYYIISSAVSNTAEGKAVLGVGQAIQSVPHANIALSCNPNHCAQSMKPDLLRK